MAEVPKSPWDAVPMSQNIENRQGMTSPLDLLISSVLSPDAADSVARYLQNPVGAVQPYPAGFTVGPMSYDLGLADIVNSGRSYWDRPLSQLPKPK